MLTVLRGLPEKQRQVLLLHAEKLSYAEIADVLGIDVADVKRSIYRGRLKMRKWWGTVNMADNGKLEDHKQKSRERDQLLLAYLRGSLALRRQRD